MSRFDFTIPCTQVPCSLCGLGLIVEVGSPPPHRCALCRVLREARAADYFAAPTPTPSTAAKTARRRAA